MWPPLGIFHQLNQAQLSALAQVDEVSNLERLHKHRRGGIDIAVGGERGQEARLECDRRWRSKLDWRSK